jgi:Helix-loop-helix DNA-binding domain
VDIIFLVVIMAGTGSSSPFIKDEPDDHLFGSSHNQRFIGAGQQPFNMQQPFNQFGNSHGNSGSINPNDLTMPMSVQNGSYVSNSFQNNFASSNTSFSKGISALDDDDILESLANFQEPHSNQNGVQGTTQNFNNLEDFDFNMAQNIYPGPNGATGLTVDQQAHLSSVYSHTPEGDPIQSPFVHNFNQQQLRHMQQQHFGSSLQSPNSFAGSPLAGSDIHNGSVDNYINAKPRPRPSLSTMQRKSSNTRSPLTPKTPVQSLNINGTESGSFPAQPIRTTHSHRHHKTASGTWDPQSAGSLTSFPGSGFSSPIQAGIHPNPQISDILKTGSLPPKLNNQGGSAPAMQTQEMKRRRRRESHNLVERRRRDNINERIQELSHLVPMHRLEDEKVRKALQNNSPLSPTLGSTSMSPPQATSGLAGPGARRATAGNITTGIPIEEKDKGPNKGDILNGAVSWTRDLMWMLHVKLQQQEELANLIGELGGQYPFEPTEDERRMQTELIDAMHKNSVSTFSYSRAPGTGLRVPKHTDVKGDPIGGNVNNVIDSTSLSPDNHSTGDAGQAGVGGAGQYWSGHNSGGSGTGSVSFKEEDEYMDLTQ